MFSFDSHAVCPFQPAVNSEIEPSNLMLPPTNITVALSHGCFSSRHWQRQLFQCEEKYQNQTCDEQERVGLEIPRLHETESAAEDFRGAVKAAYAESRDNPPVEPVCQLRQGFVSNGDERVVNLVKVEAVSHRTGEQAELGRKRCSPVSSGR